MIVITRIVMNGKKLDFVSPYCIFDGSLEQAKELCIELGKNDGSVEYFAKDVEIYNKGDYLM